MGMEVLRLIRENSDINGLNQRGYTPLQVACIYNRLGIVRVLLAAGAKIDTLDKLGRTPLMNVIRSQSNNIIEDDKAFDRLLDGSLHLDNNNNSELHYLSRFNYPNRLRQLCKLSMMTNHININGMTPLHIAAQFGLYNNFKILSRVVPPNQWNPSDYQPLLNLVVGYNDEQSARIKMIESIVAVQRERVYANSHGYNALHVAIVNGLSTIAELLIDVYPDLINCLTNGGDSPLDLAIDNDRSVISYLMDRGGQVNRVNQGYTMMERDIELIKTM